MLSIENRGRFRKIVPILLKPKIATGFNIINSKDLAKIGDAKFLLQYCHANVKEGSPHFKEFVNLLKTGDSKVINSSLLRIAYYKASPEWYKTKYGRYLDFEGRVLSLNVIKENNLKEVVKEDKEYILNALFDTKKEVIEFMKPVYKYLYRHKVNTKTGELVKENANPHAYDEAYQIPFLILKTPTNSRLIPFQKVSCIIAETRCGRYTLQSVIHKQKKSLALQCKLPNFKGIEIDSKETHLNNLAVNEYLV